MRKFTLAALSLLILVSVLTLFNMNFVMDLLGMGVMDIKSQNEYIQNYQTIAVCCGSFIIMSIIGIGILISEFLTSKKYYPNLTF